MQEPVSLEDPGDLVGAAELGGVADHELVQDGGDGGGFRLSRCNGFGSFVGVVCDGVTSGGNLTGLRFASALAPSAVTLP
jgi:hypothetical protein